MKFYSLLILGSASLLLTATAQGGEYTDQVKAQLALVRMAGQNEGWQETHDNKFDSMDSGDSKTYNITLRSGRSYKVVGVCDNDCSDLDLAIYYNGNLIKKDQQTDSVPIVEVTPIWTGQFELKVTMYACSNDPCFYGVSVLGKDEE